MGKIEMIERMKRFLPSWSPTDRIITRVSGVIAPLALFLIIWNFAQQDEKHKAAVQHSRWLMVTLSFMFDVIFVLAFTCLALRRRSGHVPPLFLWKIICIPVLVVSGGLALCLMLAPIVPSK